MATIETTEKRTWRLSPDLMSFVNREGVFFETNPAWETILGWSENEIRSKIFTELLHPDDVERTTTMFEAMKKGGSALHFENRYLCKDGSYRWLSWVAVQEGDVFFCSARDVTSDKERSCILKSHEDQALLREQFVAILGHDLRNPLAAIAAAVRIASREQHNAKIAEMFSSIEGSADRMAKLIDMVMDFASARLGGGIPVSLEKTENLAEGFAQVIDEIRLTHPDSRIEVNENISMAVVCDADRLKQMVSNLVGNAVTHGSNTRTVNVETKTAEDMLIVSITNFGQQIPDTILPNLFEPFSRGQGDNSMQGLGLGLYISDQIAKAHGGALSVVSNDEQTCFAFRMPVRPESGKEFPASS